MQTRGCMWQDFGGQRIPFLLLLLAAIANCQFYGHSLPCPTSYLDPDGDCVAGIAGKDYPLYSTFPKTLFKCADHPVKLLGYFADPVSSCQVFHVCLHDGRQESFLCPNGTLFNQQFLVCDWWFNVKCDDAYKFYQINEYFQMPINFHHGPVHPNGIPIPSDPNLVSIKKMDSFEQISSAASNNNNSSNSYSFESSPTDQAVNSSAQSGTMESNPSYYHSNDYDIMPRRPANTQEEIPTTTTTEMPITPTSIEWSMFGLREMNNGIKRTSFVKNSTLPAGLPRML